MDNNKDYYALYLKYKSKYIALKTGGAETLVRQLNVKGKGNKPVVFYKAQTGEIEKDGYQYKQLASDCKLNKKAECNEDEVVKTFDDLRFNNNEYTKVYNSYPSNYKSLIETINKGAEVYVQFIRDEIKKNKDCIDNSLLKSGIGCDAKIESIYKGNELNYKLRTKLFTKAKEYLKSQGFNLDWFHEISSILKDFNKYDKDPKLAIVLLPFNPTGMEKGELYKNIDFSYKMYKNMGFF
jgi:hypothetical protein